ncbi:DUF1223 domain-containing protein [Blastopirellula marina]|uniref:DUF1223 domain-containing protein n=1 Tax=Blastopirellula marina TaxID=124 RepID=A0A2S8GR38_9BACT|nr:DUF1223 domain-containing protein [Blastopirellula marina]PQO46893.1 DUF1223 domain-containing protein [Blastopirellula marina]
MSPAPISRRMALRLSALLAAGCGAPLHGEEEGNAVTGFALLELFTSQGCNSCPSADQNLARVRQLAQQRKLPIYTLSFHVDYWNYLGWEDPFSDAAYSQRQRRYAEAFKSERVYTPQMIVNGRVEFVGSNQATTDRAIQAGLQGRPTAKLAIAVAEKEGAVTVEWNAQNLAEQDAILFALVQKEASRDVTAGENRGKKLAHVNVVRQLQAVPFPKATGDAKLQLPPEAQPADYHVTALVQSRVDQKIAAATQAEFSS